MPKRKLKLPYDLKHIYPKKLINTFGRKKKFGKTIAKLNKRRKFYV